MVSNEARRSCCAPATGSLSGTRTARDVQTSALRLSPTHSHDHKPQTREDGSSSQQLRSTDATTTAVACELSVWVGHDQTTQISEGALLSEGNCEGKKARKREKGGRRVVSVS